LPAAVLSTYNLGILARMMRGLADVLGEDYVRTGLAKGLGEGRRPPRGGTRSSPW
jgi:ABC-type dipeptide/oligopeptide/nickel transport system permease component